MEFSVLLMPCKKGWKAIDCRWVCINACLPPLASKECLGMNIKILQWTVSVLDARRSFCNPPESSCVDASARCGLASRAKRRSPLSGERANDDAAERASRRQRLFAAPSQHASQRQRLRDQLLSPTVVSRPNCRWRHSAYRPHVSWIAPLSASSVFTGQFESQIPPPREDHTPHAFITLLDPFEPDISLCINTVSSVC